MDAKFGNVGGIQYVYRGSFDSSDFFYRDMDSGIPRGCKTLENDKLAKNDNITISWIIIHTHSSHLSFSTASIVNCYIAAVRKGSFPKLWPSGFWGSSLFTC
ncbi:MULTISPECIES: hypothetical protein [Shouchella]|uniref:hypothetical protein n=1 Tax=Shouchella TaxID=2893057 RepID=UPI0012E14ABF|nr:hypothetical protein [Shouchella clausii]MBU3263554.1 hypothetical protein [Shouchella clausii]MBU3507945.1 hypothetical protein [Shouchella clausii]MBU3535907.1 hypothetical protein [Shouchella clausii]MBX0308280.1 hypothetical protein [Shouchella clausii]